VAGSGPRREVLIYIISVSRYGAAVGQG
jgi:hypothetical protein